MGICRFFWSALPIFTVSPHFFRNQMGIYRFFCFTLPMMHRSLQIYKILIFRLIEQVGTEGIAKGNVSQTFC